MHSDGALWVEIDIPEMVAGIPKQSILENIKGIMRNLVFVFWYGSAHTDGRTLY